MTSYGPPYEQGGQQWGPPPNTPGYGSPGGPVVGGRPAAPLWPIVVITVFFALFGLIPTIIASNRASQRRESTSRYWIAFVVSLIGSAVLYVVVTLILVFVVFATAVTAVGTALDSLPTSTSGGLPTSSPTASDTTSGGSGGSGATDGPCAYTPTGEASAAASLPDDPDPTPTDAVTWTLVTSAGTVVIDLDAAAAPCTVQSMVHLTETGYFDDTPCPRSVDEGIFILQCGDPTGTGAGGPGYTFGDEDLTNADYSKGAVAMANGGPGTNGSQFFVVDRDGNDALAKNYTVFGTVTTGLDVVDKIVAAGNDGSSGAGGGKPTPAVTIVSATTS